MKKILSMVLVLCMVLGMTICQVSAAPTAKSNEEIVAVYGELGLAYAGEVITVMLVEDGDVYDKSTIIYIGETNVLDDGTYACKFKVNVPDGKSLATDYVLRARNVLDDVTESVVSAKTVSDQPMTIKTHITADKKTNTYVTNTLGDAQNAKLIYVAYDKNNAIIDVKVESAAISFAQDSATLLKSYTGSKDAAFVRTFLWNSTNELIPLAFDEKVKVTSAERFKDGDIVAMSGDSITHLGRTVAFIEHFYQTRYPDEDIVVYNNGIGGDTAAGIKGRIDYDIFEYDDINKVTVMIGMNDIGYGYYAPGSTISAETKDNAINACNNNVAALAQAIKDRGADVVLMGSPMYDEYTDGSQTKNVGADGALKRISAYAMDLAKTNGYDYIDMHTYTNEIAEDYRAANPGTTKSLHNADKDRVHPSGNGYVAMAACILAHQDVNPDVAKVTLDIENDAYEIFNADVEVTNASNTGVTYTYAPNAIPLAAYVDRNVAYPEIHYVYSEADSLFPITELLNREMITVKGLDVGNYTIKFIDEDDTEYALGTYSNADLANGINIAINANNPGQIQSIAAFAFQNSRYSNDRNYRGQVKAAHNGTSETYTWEQIVAAKDKSAEYSAKAKAASVPKTYTVVIEKAN